MRVPAADVRRLGETLWKQPVKTYNDENGSAGAGRTGPGIPPTEQRQAGVAARRLAQLGFLGLGGRIRLRLALRLGEARSALTWSQAYRWPCRPHIDSAASVSAKALSLRRTWPVRPARIRRPLRPKMSLSTPPAAGRFFP